MLIQLEIPQKSSIWGSMTAFLRWLMRGQESAGFAICAVGLSSAAAGCSARAMWGEHRRKSWGEANLSEAGCRDMANRSTWICILEYIYIYISFLYDKIVSSNRPCWIGALLVLRLKRKLRPTKKPCFWSLSFKSRKRQGKRQPKKCRKSKWEKRPPRPKVAVKWLEEDRRTYAGRSSNHSSERLQVKHT